MNKKINPELVYNFNIQQFIKQALAEDMGDGDHTSLACIPNTAKGKAHLLVKENGMLAGVELALKIFEQVDRSLKVKVLIKDGQAVKGSIYFIGRTIGIKLHATHEWYCNLYQQISPALQGYLYQSN